MPTTIDPQSPPAALQEIERLCAELELESANLEALTADLAEDLEAVKRKHMRGLKSQSSVVARRRAALTKLVEDNPSLFEKPRTLTIHGVKVGYGVSRGKVEWDDDDAVVAAIRRFCKDDVDVLLQERVIPRKDALRTLPAKTLARIGARITGAGDQVIVARVDGDVEQLIAKLTDKLTAAMVAPEA